MDRVQWRRSDGSDLPRRCAVFKPKCRVHTTARVAPLAEPPFPEIGQRTGAGLFLDAAEMEQRELTLEQIKADPLFRHHLDGLALVMSGLLGEPVGEYTIQVRGPLGVYQFKWHA